MVLPNWGMSTCSHAISILQLLNQIKHSHSKLHSMICTLFIHIGACEEDSDGGRGMSWEGGWPSSWDPVMICGVTFQHQSHIPISYKSTASSASQIPIKYKTPSPVNIHNKAVSPSALINTSLIPTRPSGRINRGVSGTKYDLLQIVWKIAENVSQFCRTK